MTACISTRSTTPRKLSSDPTGIWSGTGLAASRSRIDCTAAKKFAPVRSILLMKAMRGTLYLSACRQTVSDCGCTPATESNTATAPSRTRRLRSTSTVKSTCPGVSMMFTRWSRQNAVVHLPHLVGAAGVVEDPLGRRRLARVDVGHDPDVADAVERDDLFCHLRAQVFLPAPSTSGSARRPCWPAPSGRRHPSA